MLDPRMTVYPFLSFFSCNRRYAVSGHKEGPFGEKFEKKIVDTVFTFLGVFWHGKHAYDNENTPSRILCLITVARYG